MKLTIAGCGDAFGSGGRFNSCYLLEGSSASFMLECGATSLVALKKLGISTNSISTIFISHLHGDHFGGLPFFLIDALYPAKRSAPLAIIGPAGIEERFVLAAEVFFPLSTAEPRKFDLQFIELQTGAPKHIAGVTVTPLEVEHVSGAPSYALRFQIGDKLFAFTGDTGWTEAVIEAGRGADLYLMECSTYDLKLKMHLDYQTIARHFDRLDAKKIVLTHMADPMLARLKDINRDRCIAAGDGMTVTF